MATKTIVEQVGRADAASYAESDWQERDNFPTLEQARSYGSFKSRQYPVTPYRIVETTQRLRLADDPDDLAERIELGQDVDAPLFALEFVPDWRLR